MPTLVSCSDGRRWCPRIGGSGDKLRYLRQMKGIRSSGKTVFGIGIAALLLALIVATGAIGSGDRSPHTAGASAAQKPVKITPRGVGKVRLGKSYVALRRQGLVKKLRRGCPLGGPHTRAAALRAPLKGSVDLSTRFPRRARTILILDGATARGVGIGSTYRQIKAKFPRVTLNRTTIEIFGISLATVTRKAGGPVQLAIDADSGRVSMIGVPRLQFCE